MITENLNLETINKNLSCDTFATVNDSSLLSFHCSLKLLKFHDFDLIKDTLIQLDQWSYYRIAKFKSAETSYCNTSTTSKASKGQWWKFELHDTSATSKGKWWNIELLAELLVWYPGKIIDCTSCDKKQEVYKLLCCRVLTDEQSKCQCNYEN